MTRTRGFLACIVAANLGLGLLALGLPSAADEEKVRNPFGVTDVSDPDGEDVKTFAEDVKLPGGADDANAKLWTDKTAKGTPKSLDGEWASRWTGGSAGTDWIDGTADVKSVGERVYILYKDKTGSYLIDARRAKKDRLVGRYVNLDFAGDSGPWVGQVVDPERIDGQWGEGRWDLRRKLAEK
jgi:hypothetical protein